MKKNIKTIKDWFTGEQGIEIGNEVNLISYANVKKPSKIKGTVKDIVKNKKDEIIRYVVNYKGTDYNVPMCEEGIGRK
jgi:hypothetical protein